MVSIKEQLDLIFGEKGNSAIECSDEDVPTWYDEAKFKRGQKYFHENKMGIILTNICGLLCLMGIPEVSEWSSRIGSFHKLTSIQIFKRLQKINSVYLQYYMNDFHPKSRFWNDMLQFRKLLEISTKNGRKSELSGINQRFLTFVHFGCMGFVLTRPKKFGISTENVEDVEGFVHLWRVVGWLFGLDDSVNICRPSLPETQQLCEVLLRNIFKHSTKSKQEHYQKLFNSFNIFPLLNKHAVIFYIDEMTKPIEELTVHDAILDKTLENYTKNIKILCDSDETVQELSWFSDISYKFIQFLFYAYMKVSLFKTFCNYVTAFFLNMLINWPIFAYIILYVLEFFYYLMNKIKVIIKIN